MDNKDLFAAIKLILWAVITSVSLVVVVLKMGGRIVATKVFWRLLTIGIVFYLTNRFSEFVRAQLASSKLSDSLRDFPASIWSNPWHISMHRIDLYVGGGALIIVLLAIMYHWAGKTNTRPGEEHGSAAWAKPRDIAPFTTKQKNCRLQLTATEALSVDTYATQRNLNVLVIGAPGTGKTRGYVLPNLDSIDGISFACTDPKGEIYRTMRASLEARGINVRTLNLIDLRESARFNPLVYFSETDPETSVAQLADCIIANTAGKNRSDGFWERAERALLTALIAYAWATSPEDHEPSLLDVIDLHKDMEGSESNPDQFTSDTDLKMEAAREIVEQWQNNSPEFANFDPSVLKMLAFATRQYRVYQQGPAETRLSVVISLGVRLAPLDMHDVRDILHDDTIALDQIGKEPTALFLQIPDSHATFKFVAAMFWQSLFEKNIYIADHTEDGRLPVPLHCFLDEFANIGKIPQFEIVISTIRSRAISTSVIVQAYSQGKALWNDAWDTIVGNCDTILFLGGRDAQTTDWLSKQLGDETITMEEVSQNYGASGSRTKAQRTLKRALLTPDEIGRLPNDEALLLIRGLRPFRSKKATLKL